MAVYNFPSIPEKFLKTDVLSTDSTFKLRDIVWYTGSDGVDVSLTASDFGTGAVGWGVFEPRTSRQEFFKWDASTITSATSTGATITLRGLPFGSDYVTESSTRKFAHPSGSKVLLFTDYGAFWNTFANIANTETVTGVWTFSATPTITNAPSANTDAANKAYVDGVAVSGAPNANTTTKGIVEIATGAELAAGTGTGGTGAAVVPAGSSFTNTSSGAADVNKIPVLGSSGEIAQGFLDTARTIGAVYSFTADRCQITSDADSANDAVRQSYLASEVSLFRASGTSGEAITAGLAVYMKASDGKLYKTTTGSDEGTFSFAGFAINTTGAADATQYYTRPGGIATGLSGLTAGSYYFLSGTAGQIATSPASVNRSAKIGQALSTTTLRVCEPKFYSTGSQAITSATTFTQTTGFYPAVIKVITSIPAGTGTSPFWCHSMTDTSCVYFANGGTQSSTDGSHIWTVQDAGGASVGTISSRTQTGFVLNASTKATTNSPLCVWEAWSL